MSTALVRWRDRPQCWITWWQVKARLNTGLKCCKIEFLPEALRR